jgi:DNA repair protein RadC
MKFRHKTPAMHAGIYSVASRRLSPFGRCCTIIHLNEMIMETLARFTQTFQVAEIDLIYKTGFNLTERPKITRAADAYELLLKNWNQGRLGFIEEFKILLLNQGSFVLGEYQVSQGGVSATSVDIRLIFAAALKANASGIILAHNHPSEQLYPSEADRSATRRICEAADLFQIKVLDHLIITSRSFYSFAQGGDL